MSILRIHAGVFYDDEAGALYLVSFCNETIKRAFIKPSVLVS